MKQVFVCIGNSDDKLSQAEWSAFWKDTQRPISSHVFEFFGVWTSATEASWQNACWSFLIDDEGEDAKNLFEGLQKLAGRYNQDSISWSPVLLTEFIKPKTVWGVDIDETGRLHTARTESNPLPKGDNTAIE